MSKVKNVGARVGSLALSLLMVASLVTVPNTNSGSISDPVEVNAAAGIGGSGASGAATGSASGPYGNTTMFGYRVTLIASNKAIKFQQYASDVKNNVFSRGSTKYEDVKNGGKKAIVDADIVNSYYYDNNVTKNVLCSSTAGRSGIFYTFGATWRMSRTDDEQKIIDNYAKSVEVKYAEGTSRVYETSPNFGEGTVSFYQGGNFSSPTELKKEQVHALHFVKDKDSDPDSYFASDLFDTAWLKKTNHKDKKGNKVPNGEEIKLSTSVGKDYSNVWVCPFFTQKTANGTTKATDGANGEDLWEIMNHATVNLDRTLYRYTTDSDTESEYNKGNKKVAITVDNKTYYVSKAVFDNTDIGKYNTYNELKKAVVEYSIHGKDWADAFYGNSKNGKINKDNCFEKIMKHLSEVDLVTVKYAKESGILKSDKDSSKIKIGPFVRALGQMGFRVSSPNWGWYNLQVEPIYLTQSSDGKKALFLNGAQAAINGVDKRISGLRRAYNTGVGISTYAKACANTANMFTITGTDEESNDIVVGEKTKKQAINKVTALYVGGKVNKFKVTHSRLNSTSVRRDSRNKGFGSIVSVLPNENPWYVERPYFSVKHGTSQLTVNDKLNVKDTIDTESVSSTMSTTVKVTDETGNETVTENGISRFPNRASTVADANSRATRTISNTTVGINMKKLPSNSGINWFWQLPTVTGQSAFADALSIASQKAGDYTVVSTNSYKDTLRIEDNAESALLKTNNNSNNMSVSMKKTAVTGSKAKGYTFETYYQDENNETKAYLSNMTDNKAADNVERDGSVSDLNTVDETTVNKSILHALADRNSIYDLTFKDVRDGNIYVGNQDEEQHKSDGNKSDDENTSTHEEKVALIASPNNNDKYSAVDKDNKGKLPENVIYHEEGNQKWCNFIWYNTNENAISTSTVVDSGNKSAVVKEVGVRKKSDHSKKYTSNIYMKSDKEVYVVYQPVTSKTKNGVTTVSNDGGLVTAKKDLDDATFTDGGNGAIGEWVISCKVGGTNTGVKIKIKPVVKNLKHVDNVRFGYDTIGTIDSDETVTKLNSKCYSSNSMDSKELSAKSTCGSKEDDNSYRVLCNSSGQRYDNKGNLMYYIDTVENDGNTDADNGEEDADNDNTIPHDDNIIAGTNVLLQKNPTVTSTFSSYYIQMNEQAAGITGMVNYHDDAEHIITGSNNNFNLQHKMFAGKLLNGSVVTNGATEESSGSLGIYNKVKLSDKADGLALSNGNITGSGSMCSTYLVIIPRAENSVNIDNSDTAIKRISAVAKALNDVEDGDDQNMNHYISGEQGAGRLKNALVDYAKKHNLPSDYTVDFICDGLGASQFKAGIENQKSINDIVLGTQDGTQPNSTSQGYDVVVLTVKRCNVPILSSSHLNPDEVNHVYKNIATNRDANEFAGYNYAGVNDMDKYASDINNIRHIENTGERKLADTTANDYEIVNYVDSAQGNDKVEVTNDENGKSNNALGSSSMPLQSYFHIKATVFNKKNKKWLVSSSKVSHDLAVFKARMYQYETKIVSNDENNGKLLDNGNYQASFNTEATANNEELLNVTKEYDGGVTKMVISRNNVNANACYLGWNTMGVLTPAVAGAKEYKMSLGGKSTELTGYSDYKGTFREDEMSMILSRIEFGPVDKDNNNVNNIEPANIYDDSSRKFALSVRANGKNSRTMDKDSYTHEGYHMYTGLGASTKDSLKLENGSQAIVPSVVVPLSRAGFEDSGIKDVTSNATSYGLFNHLAVKTDTSEKGIQVSDDMLKFAGVSADSKPSVDITNDESQGKTLIISAGSNTTYKWGTEIENSKGEAATAPVMATFTTYTKDSDGTHKTDTLVDQDMTFYMIKTKLFTYRTKSHDLLLRDRGILVTHEELSDYNTDGKFAHNTLYNGSTRNQIENDNKASRIYLGFATPLGKAVMFYPEVRRVAYYCSDGNNNGVDNDEITKYEMNTVGESARTVRPISLNLLSLGLNDSQVSSITTSDTVATGTDAIALTSDIANNGKQVIYAGGNINLNSTINDGYIKLSSYALELPDKDTKTFSDDDYNKLTGKTISDASDDTALYKDFASAYKAKHPELFDSKDADGNDTSVYTEKSIAKDEFIKWTKDIEKALTPNLVLNLSSDSAGNTVMQSYTDFTSLKVSRELEDESKVGTADAEDKTVKVDDADTTWYNSYRFIVRDGMLIVDTENGGVEGLYPSAKFEDKTKNGLLCRVPLNTNGKTEYAVHSDFIQMQKDMAKDAGYTDEEIANNKAAKVGVTDGAKIWGTNSEMETMFWKSQIGQELLQSLISKYSDEDHSVTKSTTKVENLKATNVAYKWYDEGSSVFVIKRYTRRLNLENIAVQDKLDIDAGPQSAVNTAEGGTTNMSEAYTAKWYLKLFLDSSVYDNASALSDTQDAAKTKDAYLLGNSDAVDPTGTGVGLYLGEQADFLVPNATTSDMRR